MTYYFYNNRIKAFETALDSSLYEGYTELTQDQITFWQANPHATAAEIEAMALRELTDEEAFQNAKNTKRGEFNRWLNEQSELVREFPVGSKTIKLKANNRTKQNLQDLKGTLDDMIQLAMFDPQTGTFDSFFNEGEPMPISITYQELLQIRLQIASYLQNVYTKEKTVPMQFSAVELANYATLAEAIAAINSISWV